MDDGVVVFVGVHEDEQGLVELGEGLLGPVGLQVVVGVAAEVFGVERVVGADAAGEVLRGLAVVFGGLGIVFERVVGGGEFAVGEGDARVVGGGCGGVGGGVGGVGGRGGVGGGGGAWRGGGGGGWFLGFGWCVAGWTGLLGRGLAGGRRRRRGCRLGRFWGGACRIGVQIGRRLVRSGAGLGQGFLGCSGRCRGRRGFGRLSRLRWRGLGLLRGCVGLRRLGRCAVG